MKPKVTRYLVVIIALLAFIGTGGKERAASQHTLRVEIYGFVQMDAIYDFDRVDPNWNSTLRPSKIAVGNEFGHDGETIFSVKQTRFGVNGFIPTELGELKTKFEFDLFGVGVNAGQTTIRLRHAYGEIGPFLVVHTNRTFLDIDDYPNVID